MFEKEAEEILNNYCDCELLPECISGIRCRCSDFEEKKKLLLEGIEFGYNKKCEEIRKEANMFEKEVDERAKDYTENKERQVAYKCGFLDGADYNKANEWHYVKDKFPPENVPLNIITLDKNKKRRLWVGEYKGGNGEYWSGYFNHFIDVPYAWKEIVLPELEG